MTPKELVNTAMVLGVPDRVPLMCQFSIGHMLLQLDVSPVEFWFDPDVYWRGLSELRDIYDFDGILISLHGHDPDWRYNTASIKQSDEGELINWKNGDATLCPRNDLPLYYFKNEIKRPNPADLITHSFPGLLDYIPVSQDIYFNI